MNIEEEIDAIKDFCNIKILYGRKLCLLEEQLISYQSAIETLLTAYEEKSKELEKEKEKNKSLEQENSFLKMMYRGTDEFKAIEKLAEGGIKQC